MSQWIPTGDAATLRQWMKNTDPKKVEESIEDIFTKDKQGAENFVHSLVAMANARSRLMEGLAVALQKMPADKKAALLKDSMESFDGAAFGRAYTATAQLMIDAFAQDPDLHHALEEPMRQLVKHADFGKLRAAFEHKAAAGKNAALAFIGPALEDPATFASLFLMIVPVVNAGLQVLAGTLSKVDFPGELLASSLFNTLSAIDAESLGDSLTLAGIILDQIHHGSLVLGRDEFYFRKVLDDFVGRVADHIDPEVAVKAVRVLIDDMGTVLQVFSDTILRRPEILVDIAQLKIAASNLVITRAADFLGSAAQLPDDLFAKIGSETQSEFHKEELGRLINNFSAFFLRFSKNNPAFCLIDGAIQEIDGAQLGDALSIAGFKVRKAFAESPNVAAALEPEAVAGVINRRLEKITEKLDSAPKGQAGYLTRLLKGIDASLLEKFMRALFSQVTSALAQNAKQAKAVIFPLVGAGLKMTGSAIKGGFNKMLGNS